MYLKKALVALAAALLCYCPMVLNAQTQNFKGLVLDQTLQTPLIGASVMLRDGAGKTAGAITNENGVFRFEQLPVGNFEIAVSYLGYKAFRAQNIALISGKETDLRILLEEAILDNREVVVTAKIDKKKPLNQFSGISARTFSVEETNRFAAAVNDPARMAMSFAGVVSGHDGNNIISVRGNAPSGLLWRMEGIDIPNPNHFSAAGTSGGGISIISAQLLSNSDFSSGAFAAEYGNALSGIFDLKLRKGNNEKREFTFKAGILGLDVAAEGPLRAGADKGSYLLNYRYSTLGLLKDLGVKIDGAPVFQDLSFNIFMPAGKAGSFSLFGFGGLSTSNSKGSRDTSEWIDDQSIQYDYRFQSNTGVVGLKHTIPLSDKSFLTSTASISGTDYQGDAEEILLPDLRTEPRLQSKSLEQRLRFSTALTHKFNAKHRLKLGGDVGRIRFETAEKYWDEDSENLIENIRQDGDAELANAFVQWNYRPTERITFNAGLHGLFFFLNDQYSVEPRLSFSYKIDDKQSFSLGYGLHAQNQTVGNYYVKDASGKALNRDLALNKAQHVAAGYDRSLGENLRLKAEVYYQHLFDVPIAKDPNRTFSMLNLVEGYATEALENKGLGRNYGLELTLEHFMSRGFYFLLSSSLYKSEYQAADGIWRHTRFDASHAHVLTAGKEWDWSKRRKNRSISLNMKVMRIGGFRETPLDLPATQAAGYVVFQEKKAYSIRLPYYFRADVGVHLKRNYKRLTTTLSLDIQNVSNRKNVFGSGYNPRTFEKFSYYQAPLIPILAYKVQF